MKLFNNMKVKLLKEKVEAHRLAAHREGRFSLFDARFSIEDFSKTSNYDYLKWLYETLLEWEKKCNLPYDVGMFLDKIASDNTVMIHRTRLGLDADSEGLNCTEELYSIMNEGLKNYGHANAVGGGAFSDLPPGLTLTMTPLKGMAGYINLLASYHSNDTVVVSVFPKGLLFDDGEIIDNSFYDKIYDLSVFPPKVKREFMAGAILKKKNGLDEFYTRDEIVESFNATKKSGIKK